jgi:hypothetical protein
MSSEGTHSPPEASRSLFRLLRLDSQKSGAFDGAFTR